MVGGFSGVWSSLKDYTHAVLTVSIEFLNDLKIDNLILKFSELFNSVGNFSNACSETFSPAIVDFYNTAISPLVAWVGGKLSDAVAFVTDLFNDWGQWFNDNKKSIQDTTHFIADMTSDVWKLIEPLADSTWDTFKKILKTTSEIFQDFFSWVLDNKELVVAAIAGITAGFVAYKAAVGISNLLDAFRKGTIAIEVAQKAAAVTQWALNAAMNANPIGIIVGLIAGLVAAFVLLWNKSEGFRNFFISMWEGIKKAMITVINGILVGIEAFINGILKGVNWLIKGINKIKFDVPDWVPVIGGKSLGFNLKELNMVSLPRLAKGGIIDQPTLAMVGEAGKEAVVPLENTAFADSIANAILRVLTPLFSTKGNGIMKNSDGNTIIVLKIGEYELGRISVGAINKYHNVIGKVELEV